MSSGEKLPYADAKHIAIKHLRDLIMMPEVRKVAIVGSLRRKVEMVGDIDYQVCVDEDVVYNPIRKLLHHFYDKDGWTLIEHGEKRHIFRMPSGLKINVFFCHIDEWGSALMHNTGPMRYNIRKRAQVKRNDMKLNQYGLYNSRGERIASETEKDIFYALEWDYVEPEDRR